MSRAFYFSCTAVILLHHAEKPEEGLWLLRAFRCGKRGHTKQTEVRAPAGENTLLRTQVLHGIWGSTARFSQARRVQSQDGAAATCFPKASFWRRKCRLFLQGGLPLPSHISSPGGKERRPPAPWSVGCTDRAHDSSTFTTLQVGSAGKDFPEPIAAGGALLYTP